jgi:nifR3 family TIM-barrel protein
MVGMSTQTHNFWKELPRPFFALAPMADVTDAVFRQLFVKYSDHGQPHGGPHVFWTEFVSCDGLCSPGREVIKRDLEFGENEHPIVAQIFGSNPDTCLKTAELVRELGFDGVDINMGCPDRSIEKQGAGSAMIKTPDIAQEVIQAVKEGAQDIPVSVKTRVGYNKDQIDEWIPKILEMDIAALTIHARTRKEMSLVPARWEDVKRVVEIAEGTDTVILGNGDVTSLEDAKEKAEMSGADGVMIGRGAFGNPWFFNQKVSKEDLPVEEVLRVAIEHTKMFEEKLGDIKNFAIMKKHFKAYVNGFDGAKELRVKLMETKTAKEVEETINTFLQNTNHV